MIRFKKSLLTVLSSIICLTGCSDSKENEVIKDSSELNVQDQNQDIIDSLYAQIGDLIDNDDFKIEEINTTFYSKEYLEELAFNSKSNIFFGYSLEDLDKEFSDAKYVFTSNDHKETIVQQFDPYDDRIEKSIKNC